MTPLNEAMRVATMGGVSAVLVLAACATTDMAAVRPTSASAAEAPGSRSALKGGSTYADGVYTATGQYGSLPSFITVTVTLADNVITAVEVTPHAMDPTSLNFQSRFAEAIPAAVVGKRIDEVYVDRLAGSSGTPDGFNAALEQIKERARLGQVIHNGNAAWGGLHDRTVG
jgi:uncharacterized protein with FMN-binding domain